MVWVDPGLVAAVAQPFDAIFEVVERDREVAWVPAGGLEPEFSGAQVADPDQREDLKADQRWLLGELVDGDVTNGEHGDAVGVVQPVVPLGVLSEDLWIESAAPDHDDVVVIELIALPEEALLGHDQ